MMGIKGRGGFGWKGAGGWAGDVLQEGGAIQIYRIFEAWHFRRGGGVDAGGMFVVSSSCAEAAVL